ncbi:hypothetical protein EWM64_g8993 [Hericium alpestre]|uniref:HMG box domain-containing protein n=1 Tax=Hericium alpestre TaxID=135208 RepID=A0A4Y9ZL86_9AGAM|nr:hypothetical protein EWM64_g8993 [Hericium alpestre]
MPCQRNLSPPTNYITAPISYEAYDQASPVYAYGATAVPPSSSFDNSFLPQTFSLPLRPLEELYKLPSPPSTEGSLTPSPSSYSPDLPETPKRVSRRGPDHIPRPPNAFMIFRSKFVAEAKEIKTIERDHRHVSRIVASAWKMLPSEQRKVFEDLARDAKAAHALRYPNYRYKPVARDRARRKTKRNDPEDLLRDKEIGRLWSQGKKGDELLVAVGELDKDLAAGKVALPSSSAQSPVAKVEDSDTPPFRSPLLAPRRVVSMPAKLAEPSPRWATRMPTTNYSSPPMASLEAPAMPVQNCAPPTLMHLMQPHTTIHDQSGPYFSSPTSWTHPAEPVIPPFIASSQSYVGADMAPALALWGSPMQSSEEYFTMSMEWNQEAMPAPANDFTLANFLNGVDTQYPWGDGAL